MEEFENLEDLYLTLGINLAGQMEVSLFNQVLVCCSTVANNNQSKQRIWM
jgi:hypothetical protein